MILDPTIEFVRQWISTGALLGCLTIASRLWLQNRRLSMQSKAEDRQGYGALITTLQEEVKRINTAHVDCENRLLAMQGEINGLRRMIVMHSGMGAVALSSTVTEAADRTAAHVMKAMDRDDKR